MPDDISKKISEVLSNPDMMQKLGEVMNSLSASNSNMPKQSEATGEITENAKNIISSLSHTDDRRITLLTALKPYLRESRASGVDTAIKILKMSKLTEVFKNIDI